MKHRPTPLGARFSPELQTWVVMHIGAPVTFMPPHGVKWSKYDAVAAMREMQEREVPVVSPQRRLAMGAEVA